MSRILKLLLVAVVAIAIPASFALAMGFKLSESKEELKLNCDVTGAPKAADGAHFKKWITRAAQ